MLKFILPELYGSSKNYSFCIYTDILYLAHNQTPWVVWLIIIITHLWNLRLPRQKVNQYTSNNNLSYILPCKNPKQTLMMCVSSKKSRFGWRIKLKTFPDIMMYKNMIANKDFLYILLAHKSHRYRSCMGVICTY